MKFLIDDWKKAWKFATVRFWVVVGVLAQILDAIPMTATYWLDPTTANILTGLSVLSIGLRLYKQEFQNATTDSSDTGNDA